MVMVGAALAGIGAQAVLAVAPYRQISPAIYGLLAALGLLAAAGHVRQARQSRGRVRVGWAAAVIASALWGIGNLMWLAVPAWVPHNGSLSPADSVVTIAATSIPVALMLASPSSGSTPLRLRRLIDGACVAAALAFLAWQLVFRDILPHISPDSLGSIVTVLGAELVSGAYAVVVLSRARRRDGSAITLMAAALAVFSVFTVLDAANTTVGLDRYSRGVGGGYLVATLLMAACSRSPLPTAENTRAESDQAGWWQALPYVPIGLAFVVAARQQIVEGHIDAVSFWVLLSMAVLVLARQFLQLRTNQELMGAIRHQALHDGLTGLANRSALTERARSLRPGATVGVLMLDLDGFKPVNDTFGHAAGDELLRIVAQRIRSQLRPGDLAVRLGGDEFVVLLPEVGDAAQAAAVGERVLAAVQQSAVPAHGVTVAVRSSAGLAVAPAGDTDLDALLRDADAALYAAKGAGKNHLRVYEGAAAPS